MDLLVIILVGVIPTWAMLLLMRLCRKADRRAREWEDIARKWENAAGELEVTLAKALATLERQSETIRVMASNRSTTEIPGLKW